jgi:signal transduction histidine kinase
MLSTLLSCPHCGSKVDAQGTLCRYCGVNLAFAAVMAEREIKLPLQVPMGTPMKPEILVPRLGDYLIEKGVLTQKELEKGLAYQRQHKEAGNPILIGQALVELGFISSDALDQAITVQILLLQSALKQTNLELDERVQERTSELQAALEKLNELNQLKSNFISSISHELRTPLTHIRGYLEVLADGSLGELTGSQIESIAAITKAEERLEALIENLIQFSLAARGELTLHWDTVDLAKIATDAVQQSLHKASNKDIDLTTNITPGLPAVNGDRDKLLWVVYQLIDNGIKFTPEEGCVKVDVANTNNTITVSVRDTGIGISADRLDEIFEPFHQLDGSSTRRYGGTGIGLALMNRIIDAHMSKIVVSSQDGQGSKFSFSLPVLQG